MNWIEILTLMCAIFIANVGILIPLFLWTRSEANADRREANQRMDEFRKDSHEFKAMWARELKDFHGRLCSLEERLLKK